MTHRVLVTRSQPGAQATAAALVERGYAAIVEPLLSIEAIPAAIPEFDTLAFTSVNGVRHFRELSSWRDGPVWCVGERTAAEARAAGYRQVQSAGGDVSDLSKLIANEAPSGASVLHAGNEESRGDLAGSLKTQGFQAAFLPIYRSKTAQSAGPELTRALAGEDVLDYILIHSPKAGAVLTAFALASPQRGPLRLAAISQQAALKLSDLGVDVAVAARPTEEALFEALEGFLGRG